MCAVTGHDIEARDRFLVTLRQTYPDHTWERVTAGHSGASVYRLTGKPSYYLKMVARLPHLNGDQQLNAEADRLPWLAAHGVPVPEVVKYDQNDDFEWLVTAAVPGRSAAEPWPAAQRGAVVDALADLARTLHAIPVVDCPFDRSLAVTLPAARQAAERGLVADLVATVPTREELVVCHGDYCVPNILLDPRTLTVTGVIDVGRLGVADRYADLALITRSLDDPDLNPQYRASRNGFPGSAGRRFLERYGAWPVDREREAFYRLLDRLS